MLIPLARLRLELARRDPGRRVVTERLEHRLGLGRLGSLPPALRDLLVLAHEPALGVDLGEEGDRPVEPPQIGRRIARLVSPRLQLPDATEPPLTLPAAHDELT